ncbi:TPA: hypothetical protein QDB04_000116 [Burkholderia vietnamiensis]|nr:hypothetical protein [Burkholderia vietnamiensis]
MKIEVTKSTIKSVANKLVARLNAIGLVSKTGNPVVVDQGYEAVAAILGFRNQHTLRSKLPDLAAAEHHAASEWTRIANAQGWNEESQIIHLEGFLADQGLMSQFVEYARAVAAEESSAEDGPTFKGVPGDYDLLRALDYDVLQSDLKGWYWEYGVTDEASEDYRSEEAAWRAAWRDAFDKQDDRVLTAMENILTEQGYTVCADVDVSGTFCWYTDADTCESRFTLRETAVLDAWQHFQEAQPDSRYADAGESGAVDSMKKAVEEVEQQWGAEHPYYTREDWQNDVARGDTKLGYWEWVVHNIESRGGEDEHCECGNPLDDGEGYDGKCGHCADVLYAAEVRRKDAKAATEALSNFDFRTVLNIAGDPDGRAELTVTSLADWTENDGTWTKPVLVSWSTNALAGEGKYDFSVDVFDGDSYESHVTEVDSKPQDEANLKK